MGDILHFPRSREKNKEGSSDADVNPRLWNDALFSFPDYTPLELSAIKAAESVGEAGGDPHQAIEDYLAILGMLHERGSF